MQINLQKLKITKLLKIKVYVWKFWKEKQLKSSQTTKDFSYQSMGHKVCTIGKKFQ